MLELTKSTIYLATNNMNKFEEIRNVLENSKINLRVINIKGNEIQAFSVLSVARQSALNIAEKFEGAFLVEDSGLYIDAICKGFDIVPEITEEIRKKIISLYHEKGIKFLQKEVFNKDRKYYTEIDKNNPQRLMRALEVIYSTGQPFSSFRTKKNKKRSKLSCSRTSSSLPYNRRRTWFFESN